MCHLAAIKKNTYLSLVVLLAFLVACERYDFERTSVDLNFSADTVSFDTVFAPLGSTTFKCLVYNHSDKNLIIDEVFLVKAGTSPFRINVDGHAGSSVHDIYLAKKDSMYIEVEVLKNKELLLTDQIVFILGGIEQASRITLTAYGQEVVLFPNDTVLRVDCDLDSNMPYLSYGNITVDSGVIVTVKAGAKLYFSKNKGIVVNGALIVDGQTPTTPCIFSHPRYKDPWYSTASGQWQGIIINGTGYASINYAQIHGARRGISVQDTLEVALFNVPQLDLSKSRIEYTEIGLNLSNGSAVVDNILCTNSITNALLIQGGNYHFYQSTFSDTTSHGPLVVLQNFRIRGPKDTVSTPLVTTIFSNDIIYGSNTNELVIRERAGVGMSYDFEYSLIKTNKSYRNFDNVIINENPKFKDVNKNDFHLSEGSPAINTGLQKTAFDIRSKVDLDGVDRTIPPQDSSMGCYAYRYNAQQ